MASQILNINVSGMVFPMTEAAYQNLQDYLASIRAHFSRHQGREEIVADVESRLAEHFSAKVSSKHQVLLESDVRHFIEIVGRPEDFGGSGDAGSEDEVGDCLPSPLYRDTEAAIIAGVCAGLGHYFKIDPLLVRLVFFLSLFAGGLGLLVYLLLWILVPEAKTAFQKEQMHRGRMDLKQEVKKVGKRIRKALA